MHTFGSMRKAGLRLHSLLARHPRIAEQYFRLLGYWAPKLNAAARSRLLNNINAVSWPSIRLKANLVAVGKRTKFRLNPHFGEFDSEALVSDQLSYEHEVFTYLETIIDNYDTIIDIGANVGVYSLFFAIAGDSQRAGTRKVYSFEPSRRAFHRLLKNLESNHVKNVFPFNCAVGRETG